MLKAVINYEKVERLFRIKTSERSDRHLAEEKVLKANAHLGGAYYKALVELYLKQMKEDVEDYRQAILQSIDSKVYIDKSLLDKIKGMTSSFTNNQFQQRNAELRGRFAHDNVLNSIIIEAPTNYFKNKHIELVNLIADLIIVEVEEHNRKVLLNQEKDIDKKILLPWQELFQNQKVYNLLNNKLIKPMAIILFIIILLITMFGDIYSGLSSIVKIFR